MTDDLRTRIAAVLQAHRWGVFRCSDGWARTCCRCQWRELSDGPTHAEHVADAVIRELPQPIKPTPPDLEDLTSIPDLKHDWGREWDGDVHQGRICTKCEEISDCELCSPEWDSTYDCLVIQADNRNDRAMRLYAKAIERWEAQMDYWRELTSG